MPERKKNAPRREPNFKVGQIWEELGGKRRLFEVRRHYMDYVKPIWEIVDLADPDCEVYYVFNDKLADWRKGKNCIGCRSSTGKREARGG